MSSPVETEHLWASENCTIDFGVTGPSRLSSLRVAPRLLESSSRMSVSSELLLTVAMLLQQSGSDTVGQGTGFFYTKNDVVYLVTNRHVVLDEEKGLRPDALSLRLHTDPADLTKTAEFRVPLYTSGKPAWHVHPSYDETKIDVAVVEVDQAIRGFSIKTLSTGNFFPPEYVIRAGEDVMLIGFPLAYSDAKHALPIVRNGMIASTYGLDFQGLPLFVLDANVQPGTSGSPVFTKPKNIWTTADGGQAFLTGDPVYFLGVFSGTLRSPSRPDEPDPMGLGAVWYARTIEEIIDSIAQTP